MAIGSESKDSGEAMVRRILRAIVRRGPEEEGLLVVPRLAVGTRGLSIIDLAGGSQLVWNETGTLADLGLGACTFRMNGQGRI